MLELIRDQVLQPNRGNVLDLGPALGFAMHRGFYIHGEWQVQAPAIVYNHCPALAALSVVSASSPALESWSVFRYPSSAAFGYFSALFTSIVTHRLFLNRLAEAQFPSPIRARVSKLWHTWACRWSRHHLVLQSLRQKMATSSRRARKRRAPS